jgi:hypothetical protein
MTETPQSLYTATPAQPATLLPPLTETPQLFYTATPDPNMFTISAVIDGEHSQEEIAKTLYTAWLDHFLSENISPEMRLDEYAIKTISIPLEQKCAKELGGVFVAEADVTAKTFFPIYSSTENERSNWFVAGGGNILDASHLSRLFSGVISRSENNYTLLVITRIPMCD